MRSVLHCGFDKKQRTMSDDRFDGLLMQMAQQQQVIEPMLTNVFGFLRRKTELFSGATQDTIEEMVLNVLRKAMSRSHETRSSVECLCSRHSAELP